MSLTELEQDPFDADEFVERLAWRAMSGTQRSVDSDFDPVILREAFQKTIKEMKELNVRLEKKADRLQDQCVEEEKAHWQRMANLQKNNQVALSYFQGLDERINYVATKVVHVGDQLEGINKPRKKAAEAQNLMSFLSEFIDYERPQSELFNDPFQLHLAADIIQKLHLIAVELPNGDKFDRARKRIQDKYTEVEANLIFEFKDAHHAGDKKRMKRTASVLVNFKGHNQCIEIFIEETQRGAYIQKDVYEVVPGLCARTSSLVQEVFAKPDEVMSKLVTNIFYTKIQTNIQTQLADQDHLEKYLQNLYTLFTKTTKLCTQLSTYNVGSDSAFLSKITKTIFSRYLDTYITTEINFLHKKSGAILQKFYEQKGHQRKQISSGGMHEFRRDLQAFVGTKANINFGPAIENYGGETFLSQEVALNLLQESKQALKRCQVLSGKSDLAFNASKIFDVLMQFLCHQHIEYALELGLQAIPLADPKTEPEVYFFEVVREANPVFHLFDKQYRDSLAPLLVGSPKASECLAKKRDVMESMESRLDNGLDRAISTMSGWLKQLLAQEQKKSDFKPENDDVQMSSTACAKACKYIAKQHGIIKECLDGKNVESVLTEFGIRIHRTIFEHVQKYEYNSIGAMLAICDVNKYSQVVRDFNVPVVSQLFDTLHNLCNLLVVLPDNLKRIYTEELPGMDKSVILTFVQLRTDYKANKLANCFK